MSSCRRRGWGEKEGTFINTERRIQRVRAAVRPRGEAKAAWWIFKSLSERLGYARHALRVARGRLERGADGRAGAVGRGQLRQARSGARHLLPLPDRRIIREPRSCTWAASSRRPSGRAQLKPVLFDPVEVPESERKAFEAPIVGHIAERPDADYPFMLDDGTGRHALSHRHHDAPVTRARADRPRSPCTSSTPRTPGSSVCGTANTSRSQRGGARRSQRRG